MNLSAPPDKDVAAVLEARTRSSAHLVLNRNLYRGPERPPCEVNGREQVPRQCVFVLLTSGDAPTPYHDSPAREELRFNVNIRVRSEVNAFEDGQHLARIIWFAIHREDLGPSYIDCACTESVPRYVGEDDIGHHRWDIPLNIIRHEVMQ